MAEDLQTYHGACHCRSFKFTLTIPRLTSAWACNCTVCTKKGALWARPPTSDHFQITKGGYDGLTGYSYTGVRTLYFCSTCGTQLFTVSPPELKGNKYGVNIRALDDFNIFDLETKVFDGRTKLPGEWTPAVFNGQMPTGGPERAKLYTGSCHCGAVTLAVRSAELEGGGVDIKEDNCSICQRNSNVLVYPHQSQVVIDGADNLAEYTFGRKFTGHRFCKTCGVQVCLKIYGPPKEVFDQFSPEKQAAVRPRLELLPLRVGVLDGIDMEKLKIARNDIGTEGYVVD